MIEPNYRRYNDAAIAIYTIGNFRFSRSHPKNTALRFFAHLAVVLILSTPTSIVAQTNSSDSGNRAHSTDVIYRYYEIEGETADDLLSEMVRKGPQRSNRKYFALTEALPQLSFKTLQSNDGCRLINIEVHTAIVVTLPTRINVSDNSEMQAKWKVFEIALQNHEGWHVASAKAAGRQIFESLSAIVEPDCLLAKNRARVLSEEIQKDFASKNEAYDRTTGHGRSQGASWPP